MACGLPVIATAVGGNADLVVAGKSGEIIPAADPEAMAREIVRLANAPDLAKAMGQAGRQVIEQKFSMKAMVAAYQGTYDKLLRRTGANLKH
jgi:glycosyltransferase involved in cell wall biosynthesis